MSKPQEMRVRPRAWLGVVGLLFYLAVFYGIWIVNGIDYGRIGESEDTLWKWYVAPLAGGAVVLVILVSAYGWWRPSLFETKKRLPGWIWILPAIFAAAAVANFFSGDTSKNTPMMWLLLVIGSILVGFNEELVTRGQLIVALRSRFGELGVWFFSTLLFGLLHLPNTLFGTGPLGVSQVLLAFLFGSVLYLTRRVSGNLIIPMFAHALWDFSSFAVDGAIALLIGPVVGVIGVIAAVHLARRESKEEKAAPSNARGAATPVP